MPVTAQGTPFSLAPLLPPQLRHWAAPLEPALCKALIPGEVMQGLERARRVGVGAEFASQLLAALGIGFQIHPRDLDRMPAGGPGVVVANHPFGILDGLIAAVMLNRIRQDWKILANSVIGALPELRDRMILVNPFGTPGASLENRVPLRRAIEWLNQGGLLFTFPAGEVAHLNLKEHAVTDPCWNTASVRLALRAACPAVPVFFEGCNSVPFQLAGILHPRLRTFGLAREFHKMRGKTVHVHVGSPVPSTVLAEHRSAEHATTYLRSRTYFLSNRSGPSHTRAHHTASGQGRRTIAPAEAAGLLVGEIASLPPECELAANSEMAVYLAPSAGIPRMLREIGRCREIAFRRAGEGTGEDVDLDRFDAYYQHLFLWSKTDQRLAGAYRLALTSDVLRDRGISGLYTSTLFHFDPRFFERMGPAIELGRSFVMPEYQRSYAALLLLWKGIVRMVIRRPEAPMLFGAVSISREYHEASRSLIAQYLVQSASHELASLVRPRTPFRHRALRDAAVRHMASLAADIDQVSLPIADIEPDSKG